MLSRGRLLGRPGGGDGRLEDFVSDKRLDGLSALRASL
jgi:hypothetical protein